MPTAKATPSESKFNQSADLPYGLRIKDFELAMVDLYDLLYDINSLLISKDLPRIEETVKPAIFSGIISDVITASLGKHSRSLTPNQYHNGHPDLILARRHLDDRVKAGTDGIEIKATKGNRAVDTHGARDAWFCVFRYAVDDATEPASERNATRVVEITLARLTLDDYRRNERRSPGSTNTASPNAAGVNKLRGNWIYRE